MVRLEGAEQVGGRAGKFRTDRLSVRAPTVKMISIHMRMTSKRETPGAK
jgi:hypothetical protein